MAELFLAALGLVLLILLLQKLENAEIRFVAITLKWTLVGLMILAAIYLILVGRLLHVAALAILLILLLKQDVHKWIKKEPSLSPLLPPPMTKKEAAALLKVDLKATPDEIEEAFKKLRFKDSTEQDRYLQAKELLLKKKKK